MTESVNTNSCLVIGAGIAGLCAARALQERGFRVTVLDKGRTAGGRVATRRVNAAVFDYGAQFFTARDAHFELQVEEWLAAGVVLEWCRGFGAQEGTAMNDGHPRYRGRSGMNALPVHLAIGLDIVLGQRAVSAEVCGAMWVVRTETGLTLTADSLVVTSPAPESIAILSAGKILIPAETRAALEAICYESCIALMVQPVKSCVPAPGGIQLTDEPIAWIGDNFLKGISPCPAVTIHASAEFSRSNWGSDDREVASLLLSAAREWVPEPGSEVSIHRWRYAKATAPHAAACLSVPELLPMPNPFVVYAGDAFGATRSGGVERAALSGLAAARAVLAAHRISE